MLLKSISPLMMHLLLMATPAINRDPVLWNFEYFIKSHSVIALHANATLAPGWHIYSQFLEEGGPMPTQLTLEADDEIQLIGHTEEKGNPVHYFDTLYNMDIVWYSENVSFVQIIRVGHLPNEVSGSLNYIMCNEHLCIPGKSYFTIPVKR